MFTKRWLSPKEFAQEFGISLSTQAKKRSARQLPYSKWGGIVVYDRFKIDEMFEAHNVLMWYLNSNLSDIYLENGILFSRKYFKELTW